MGDRVGATARTSGNSNVVPLRPNDTVAPVEKQTRRSFGKIRKLPSGRFQASYIGKDGKRHVAPVTFDGRGDAGSWLDMRHAELLEHRWKPPAPPTPDTTTFRDYATTWVERRRNRDGEPLKPRTKQLYKGLLDGHILPAFGDYAVTEITADMVDDWHDDLLPKAPTRRAHAYTLLHSIMKSASTGRRRLIENNPCQIEHATKAKRKFRPTPATPDEIRVLVAAMPERFQLMVLLGAWCGLRYGELAELRRLDLDVKGMKVHVQRGVTWLKGETVVGTPKSHAGDRIVSIPNSMKADLKRHLRDFTGPEPDALLFPAASGKHLHPSTLMKHFRKARAAAGRPDLRFHDLRHTAATTAAQTGATLAELMARMGHSTSDAALVYQHVAAERDKEIAAGIDKLIVTPKGKKKGR